VEDELRVAGKGKRTVDIMNPALMNKIKM